MAALTPDNRKIETAFLFYYLRARQDFLNQQGSGAIFKAVTKTILGDLQINLPSLERQREIVRVLDKVEAVIDKHKRQLAKLDELAKARFVEMFGDGCLNTSWPRLALGDLCDVRDGTHDSPKYQSEGYPLVTSKNVTKGSISFSSCSYISQSDFDSINVRSRVDKGDIIMPMIGTIGYPVIVETVRPFAIKNLALIKFPPNARLVNIFVKHLLLSSYFEREVLSKLRGGNQKFISLGSLRKLRLNEPPLPLQRQFAEFVTHIERMKGKVRASLEATQKLLGSLMQEYFS